MNKTRKSFVVLLNGEPYKGEINAENSYVICCDGAYSWAKGRVKIDENLGDFDSLDEKPDPAPLKIYSPEKDETDGELAVDRAVELGATDLVIYGGGGKREDHFLGNLHLLYKAKEAGMITAALLTNGAEIHLCGEGGHEFVCGRGETVSVLPFGGAAHIMNTEGLKYPMNDMWLRYGSTRGISNVATSAKDFFIRVKKGFVLVILNGEGI